MLGPQLGLSQLVEQAGPCGVSLLYQGLQTLPCGGWGMCVVRLGQPSPGASPQQVKCSVARLEQERLWGSQRQKEWRRPDQDAEDK